MGVDEEGTLARLKAHRHALVDPKIAENRGRIVKTTGDGMLVEFASVVDALRCAVEVQRRMAVRNTEVPQEKRIEFRVGIHQGDVITSAVCLHFLWRVQPVQEQPSVPSSFWPRMYFFPDDVDLISKRVNHWGVSSNIVPPRLSAMRVMVSLSIILFSSSSQGW
jgi:hypothetical protein